ncbi:acyltransferase family protein [Spirosoma foliorum]|uniref:Acyltransferase n=1 Tax=Spirosoma foliorum TaxID=2710596 RepID=A0A7G5GYP0_9BACT|nr:acyltransferase [Spirosoma foliorum]QMW03982.1 acyltransferase [Spirosoma foliorum]
MRSHSDKLIKLEAIRGFAATYVAIGHIVKKTLIISGINFAYIFRFGQEAVILFFILSGIVMQYSFARAGNYSFSHFFLKRFLRIYIPLFFIFLANYGILIITENTQVSVSWPELVGNIAMLQDYGGVKVGILFGPFLGNLPLWSLSYEWWFYFIFFYLYTKFGKMSGLYAYSISILAAISYFFYPTFIGRVFMYLSIWWIGADIGLLYFQGKDIFLKTLLMPLASILCVTIILTINFYFNGTKTAAILHDSGFGVSPILELRHFLFVLFIIPISLLWKSFGWVGFNMIFGIFGRIAPISFALYISHWFLVANANYLDNIITNKPIQISAYIIICVGFSYLVERRIYPTINHIVMNKVYKQHNLNEIAILGQ